MSHSHPNIWGAGFLILSLFVFSLQDIAVRWMGDDYSVLQIVLLRSLVALPATLFFFRREGGRGLPKTQRHKLEYVRGAFQFLSFTTYMMAVTALPLSELAAIRNSGPMMITLLSVVWAAGMYFNARAYSQAQASVIAPFEYASLLIAVTWGFLLWQEVPTVTTWLGAALTLTSGLYLLYLDR